MNRLSLALVEGAAWGIDRAVRMGVLIAAYFAYRWVAGPSDLSQFEAPFAEMTVGQFGSLVFLAVLIAATVFAALWAPREKL